MIPIPQPCDGRRVSTLRCAPASRSYVEAIDRLLDKGIVIDAWMRIAVGGIDLIGVDVRVIVASIDAHCSPQRAAARAPTSSRFSAP